MFINQFFFSFISSTCYVYDYVVFFFFLLQKKDSKNQSLNVKFLYRRATALHKMGGESLKKALSDFQSIVKMEPTNGKAVDGVESVLNSIGLYQSVKAKTPSNKKEETKSTNKTSPTKSSPSSSSTTSTTPSAQDKIDRAAAPTTKTTSTPVVHAAVESARKRAAQIPSTPPKTSFEIEKVRRELKSDMNAWGEYLHKIPTKKLVKIIGSSLSEDMLSSMIQGIAAYFIPTYPKRALSFMKQLAKVNRFGTNLMMLETSDNQILVTIFVSLSSCNVNQETLKKVRKTYGV